MNFVDAFVLAMLALIILMYIKNYYGEVEYMTARTDGRRYLVRKLRDRQQAAELLARVNARLGSLVKHMAAEYPDNEDAQRLLENYNPESVSEGGTEVGYTSYSVNKGEKIVLCIRQKETNAFVDINTIMYVSVHELGHLMTDEIGHTDKFWKNFRWLLKEAIDVGLYKHVDFAKKPHQYCGITISSSVI